MLPSFVSLILQNWDRQDQSFIHGQSVQQVVGLPVPSQLQSANRASPGLMDFQNAHLQQAFNNARTPQTMGQSSSSIRSSSHLSRAHIQQGNAQVGTGQTSSSLNNQQRFKAGTHLAAIMARQSPSMPVQNQTPRTRPSLPVNVGGTMQAVSGADGSVDLSSEQNWRPTGRMRGSLSGRAYSAAFHQFIIAPTQPTQAARPPPNLTSPPPVVPSQPETLIGNMSAQVPQTHNSHPQ